MTYEEEQKLNKKLAEWAGNIQHNWDDEYCGYPLPDCICRNCFISDWPPSKEKEPCIPPFTRSLDACIEWLVPKITERGYDFILSPGDHGKKFNFEIFYFEGPEAGIPVTFQGQDDMASVAFCIATEKLIDDQNLEQTDR